MVTNQMIGAGIGFVPLVGDVFMAIYRPNSRNSHLLEKFLIERAAMRWVAVQPVWFVLNRPAALHMVQLRNSRLRPPSSIESRPGVRLTSSKLRADPLARVQQQGRHPARARTRRIGTCVRHRCTRPASARVGRPIRKRGADLRRHAGRPPQVHAVLEAVRVAGVCRQAHHQ
jgi:hypothetical protein